MQICRGTNANDRNALGIWKFPFLFFLIYFFLWCRWEGEWITSEMSILQYFLLFLSLLLSLSLRYLNFEAPFPFIM